MTEKQTSLDRLIELLAEQMERDLSPVEGDELRGLLGEHPEWQEHDLALAAAAVDAAYATDAPGPAELPNNVVDRVVLRAHGFFDAMEAREPEQPDVRAIEDGRTPATSSRTSWIAWSGWVAAAAAIIFVLLRKDPAPDPETSASPVEPTPAEVATSRAALMRAPDVVRLDWTGTKDPLARGVTGDVVWSGEQQAGYMRFVGLAENDPSVHQYQLWIFDAERDEAHPVDGGVFDSTGGEAIIRIDARVPVGKATLFAVTLEKPGGVVVSTRERLIALAKPG